MEETHLTADTPRWFLEPSLGRRWLAGLVDAIVLIAVTLFVLQLPIGLGTQRAVVTALTALYFVGAVTLAGRTLGKRALGLRVVDFRTGRLPGLRAAVVRWAVPAAPRFAEWLLPGTAGLMGLVALVIFLPILRPPFHRGLHDYAAGTVVTVDGKA